MVQGDPLATQRDFGPALVAELAAAGFADAEEIGRGGFGTVFRCTQRELDRTVAVKVLTAGLDEAARARFVREQRAMGRLTGHPNIVGVLQVGHTEAGHPFLVTNYHRHGSLAERIRRDGPIAVDQVLELGVKIAGALTAMHRLGIVHRDVKPANILFTDYDEPALADFGIAQVAGAFRTSAGTVTGTPAFTAPEVLGGDPPTPAADVYGLGATLFCALTGHAAFERHSGEQVVAQFLRITAGAGPDLCQIDVPDPVRAVIESAMARDPRRRPSAAVLAEQLQRARSGSEVSAVASDPPVVLGGRAGLPAELTSFVGRSRELTVVREMLSRRRVVTLTGMGGVGKTRIALRGAENVRRDFADGVSLVELADVRDPALVADAVATALGVRDCAGRQLPEILVEVLAPRATLLVLDNCEQVVEAVAELVRTFVARCPNLRILATSREALGITAETVVPVVPLATPLPDARSSLRVLSRFDSVALFVERGAATLPGFELTEDNKAVVAQICARLDGLPLAIELTAAWLRVLSPEQILERLSGRHSLLGRGARNVRGTPSRHQTVWWSIGWSHDLCTPSEQRLWAQLSVFSGGFELDDAEQVCDVDADDLLDTLTSLVDKSIVVREESGGRVRFRMLDSVRAFGREKAEASGTFPDLQRRHRDRYTRLALDAEADWISPRQIDWIARLRTELPNLREAIESGLAERDDSAMRIAVALYPFELARGLYAESRRWLDRALRRPSAPELRARALYAACGLAGLQGDLPAALARADDARALAAQTSDPGIHALAQATDGFVALCRGDVAGARTLLAAALDAPGAADDPLLKLDVLSLLGWAHTDEDPAGSLAFHERLLAVAQSRGDYFYSGYALWATGFGVWRDGDDERASRLVADGLRLARRTGDPLLVFSCLQTLAWIAATRTDMRRAAVLMGAAETQRGRTGGNAALFPNLLVHQQEFDGIVRKALGAKRFEANRREGAALSTEAAIACALGEQAPVRDVASAGPANLTNREREVADLVTEGLTNKEIAAKLVISPRTVEGHVDHILTKLDATSRAQIAAWVIGHEGE